MNYADILSFGAGVNSIALAIMAINDGWHGEIVFSDTGCEWPETMCYLDYFEREWLRPRGFEVTRLKGMPWQRYAKGISLIEYCEAARVIPLAAMRWCTSEWKVKPLQRYGYGRTFKKGEEHQEDKTMIGIAIDERWRQPHRIRPLVDAGITREGCIKIIEAEGLDVPQKSGCYLCPFQRNAQWRMLWERHPELFERAMLLEESTERSKNGYWRATLDPSGKITLRQRKLAYESQMELPDFDMDDLLRFKPCVCTL